MQYITGDSPLKVLGLSRRDYNAVIKLGIDNIEKLMKASFDEILKAPSIGSTSATKIYKALNDIRNGIMYINYRDGAEE